MAEAKKVVEAQKESWRIADLWYALQSVMENIFMDDDVEEKSMAISRAVDEFKEMLADKSAYIYNSLVTLSISKAEPEPHPLDCAISKLKADFDDAMNTELGTEEKLQLLQDSFNDLGEAVKSNISNKEPVVDDGDDSVSVAKSVSDALEPILQQLSVMSAKIEELSTRNTSTVKTEVPQIPQRRSLTPSLIQNKAELVKSTTPKLRDLVERTT
jgi:hypothetical protein